MLYVKVARSRFLVSERWCAHINVEVGKCHLEPVVYEWNYEYSVQTLEPNGVCMR